MLFRSGKPVFNGGTLQYTGATASTDRNFTINAGKTATFDVSTNNLTVSGVSTATTGALTKIGSDILTLTGANLYSGATTVSAGTLALVGGSTASGSAVTVGGTSAAGTPTLTGTGTVNGPLTIAAASGGAAGTINPGTVGGTGTLHVAATTIASTYACDLNGASSDLLASSGALTLSAGATLAITAASPTATSYTIATYTGGATPAFTTVTGLPSGYAIAYSSTAITLVQTVQADPFNGWIGGFGLTGDQQGKALDPDGDGLANLQEFAFGTNPAVSSTGVIAYVAGGAVTPGAPKIISEGGSYYMVFGRRVNYVSAGLTYTVQFSAGLGYWVDNDDITNAPEQVATDGTINAMRVKYPDAIGTPSGNPKPNPTFGRVMVTMP